VRGSLQHTPRNVPSTYRHLIHILGIGSPGAQLLIARNLSVSQKFSLLRLLNAGFLLQHRIPNPGVFPQVRLAVIFASVQLQVAVHIAGAICFLRTSPATGAELRGWIFRVLPVLEVRWSLDVASPS
jgi:hypothetical protein